MSVHLKLLVEGEDRPLFDSALLDGGSEPLLVAAFLAFCATDILSTSNGYRTDNKQAHNQLPVL